MRYRSRWSFVPAMVAVAATAGSAAAQSATVTIDRGQKYQRLEGFGFFGAHDVWWGSAEDMVDEDWVRMLVEDLGLSMWRNEYYPPADGNGGQDADWEKQRPIVIALRDQALASGVPLKMIVTVWSPPASMKCLYNDDGIQDGTPHPDGTKGGGSLCPSQREAFADWLVDGLSLYAAEGIDVYGLSFQNEPFFWQSYNSCFYSQPYYAETLALVGSRIKAAYPNVRLFGAENMLEIEVGGSDWEYFYTGEIAGNAAAVAALDALAVHGYGYSDGVLASSTSRMSTLWSDYRTRFAEPLGKPVWMTETSGYVDDWEGDGDLPGALDLAQAIYAALYYGQLSAWVWWQGSELGRPNEFAMMQGTTVGKRYYVSKQFYRFLRQGARMVDAASDDSELLVAAFGHQEIDNFVGILINAGAEAKSVALIGDNLPDQFNAYRTSASEDCVQLDAPATPDSIQLPPRSLTTVIAGS